MLPRFLVVALLLTTVGCAAKPPSPDPQLRFRQLLTTRGGTWATFELHNPNRRPVWFEGMGHDSPVERWLEETSTGDWTEGPGFICLNGSEPYLVPPRSSVWLRSRVHPEAYDVVRRLGVRILADGAGHFGNDSEIVWSDPFRLPALPATRPAEEPGE